MKTKRYNKVNSGLCVLKKILNGVYVPFRASTPSTENMWKTSSFQGSAINSAYVPTLSEFNNVAPEGYVDGFQLSHPDVLFEYFWGDGSGGSYTRYLYSTYIISDTDQTIDIVFAGDDGHSLYADGTLLGGAGFGIGVVERYFDDRWLYPLNPITSINGIRMDADGFAQAEPITFSFTGTIDSIDFDAGTPSEFSVGDSIKGTYTFDPSDSTDVSDDPNSGYYYNSLSNISFSINAYSASFGGGLISVANGSYKDLYRVQSGSLITGTDILGMSLDYLRASTKEQNADRAKGSLQQFASEHDLIISTFFTENESGASLQRPELFRLLEIAKKGDILLVEQIDRISQLKDDDWNALKSIIKTKGLWVVSLDLPTSHQFAVINDEFTGRMLSTINDLMLDMLAAIARKDYVDRRRRQKEGISKAKSEGRYPGRPNDTELQKKIEDMLSDKKSYNHIQHILGCSRTTISKVSKRLKQEN